MLWAAFTLAFFGFLRSSEFTCNGLFDPSVHLTSNDITLVPNSHSPNLMLVHIKQSKTDPFQQDHTITIAKSSSPICSVMAMKVYLLQAQPPSSQPLFAFAQPRHWLTRNNLTTERRTILQHCGLPCQQFLLPQFPYRSRQNNSHCWPSTLAY